jgi:hypothetical protein
MALGLLLHLQPGIVGGQGPDAPKFDRAFPFYAVAFFLVVVVIEIGEIIVVDPVPRLPVEPGGAGIEHRVVELDARLIAGRLFGLEVGITVC